MVHFRFTSNKCPRNPCFRSKKALQATCQKALKLTPSIIPLMRMTIGIDVYIYIYGMETLVWCRYTLSGSPLCSQDPFMCILFGGITPTSHNTSLHAIAQRPKGGDEAWGCAPSNARRIRCHHRGHVVGPGSTMVMCILSFETYSDGIAAFSKI